jgi:glucokinase
MRMLLAGDLGGTKTHLGLFERARPRPVPTVTREFTTLDYPDLPTMVAEFLAAEGVTGAQVETACIGIAGPVFQGGATLTNVPWRVEATPLRERVGLHCLVLLNDVEALAHAVPVLGEADLAVLQAGTPVPAGNGVLITIGTGFGQAFLHRVEGRFTPLPSEGGHVDFAARTPREIELLRHLTARFGRVDVERIVSGQGLGNIAEFTHGGRCRLIDPQVEASAVPAAVSAAAVAGRCPACREALELMVGALGSAAGNVAILGVARGGVFIGGGIPAKILPVLQSDLFVAPFRAKPPMDDLLAAVPVYAILHPEAGLLGAAVHAASVAE